MLRPTTYRFSGIDEIVAFLEAQAESDPTFEGVVIRDRNNQRWKVKSPAYLCLHRMGNNGNGVSQAKNLLPFILKGEEDELLAYFPEARPHLDALKLRVQQQYIRLLEVWAEYWTIDDQKAFAMAIKDKTPFTSLLFDIRKRVGQRQVPADVREAWQRSEQLILKNLA